MTEMMQVELIGGPLDGESRVVATNVREYRMALSDLPEAWHVRGDPWYINAVLGACRYAVYAAVGKPTEFHWKGIPDSTAERARIEREERAELARLKAKYEPPEQP